MSSICLKNKKGIHSETQNEFQMHLNSQWYYNRASISDPLGRVGRLDNRKPKITDLNGVGRVSLRLDN